MPVPYITRIIKGTGEQHQTGSSAVPEVLDFHGCSLSCERGLWLDLSQYFIWLNWYNFVSHKPVFSTLSFQTVDEQQVITLEHRDVFRQSQYLSRQPSVFRLLVLGSNEADPVIALSLISPSFCLIFSKSKPALAAANLIGCFLPTFWLGKLWGSNTFFMPQLTAWSAVQKPHRPVVCLGLFPLYFVAGYSFQFWGVAQLVKRRTGTPLTQVRFPVAAGDFPPGVNFQCRLCYVHLRVQSHALTSVWTSKILGSMSEFGGLWKH